MGSGAFIHLFHTSLPARQGVPGVQTGKVSGLVDFILGLGKQLTSKSISKKISGNNKKESKGRLTG